MTTDKDPDALELTQKGPEDLAEIDLDFATLRRFQAEFAPNLSYDGLFIETEEPLPASTVVRFRVLLPDNFVLVEGTAVVVWTREQGTIPGALPGMALRFATLGAQSKELIDKIVDTHIATGGVPFEIQPLASGLEEIPDGSFSAEVASSGTSDEISWEEMKNSGESYRLTIRAPGEDASASEPKTTSPKDKDSEMVRLTVRGSEPSPATAIPLSSSAEAKGEEEFRLSFGEVEDLSPSEKPSQGTLFQADEISADKPGVQEKRSAGEPAQSVSVKAPGIPSDIQISVQVKEEPTDSGMELELDEPISESKKTRAEESPKIEEPKKVVETTETATAKPVDVATPATTVPEKLEPATPAGDIPPMSTEKSVASGIPEMSAVEKSLSTMEPEPTQGENQIDAVADEPEERPPSFSVTQVTEEESEADQRSESSSEESVGTTTPEPGDDKPESPIPPWLTEDNLPTSFSLNSDGAQPPDPFTPKEGGGQSSAVDDSKASEKKPFKFEIPKTEAPPRKPVDTPGGEFEVSFFAKDDSPDQTPIHPLAGSAAEVTVTPREELKLKKSRRPMVLGTIVGFFVVLAAVGTWWYLSPYWPRGTQQTPIPVAVVEETPVPENQADSVNDQVVKEESQTEELTTDQQPSPKVEPTIPEPEPTPRSPEPTQSLPESTTGSDFGPARRVTDIRAVRVGQQTKIKIRGAGTFREGAVKVSTMADPPRILVRIFRIEEKYDLYQLDVGTPEVLQIRTGHHPELNPPALYVVLDLVDDSIQETDTEIIGDVIVITTGRP